MEVDMHFYGVYALARAGGVKPKTARLIASSSQYVDDAIEDNPILVGKRAIFPLMTSHKLLDSKDSLPGDQWNVWVPFHFLPGNGESAQTFEEAMSCTKNSKNAEKILQYALKYKTERLGPFLAGIVSHAYAETFSHYGFIGTGCQGNRVDNKSIRLHVKSKSIYNYLNSKLDLSIIYRHPISWFDIHTFRGTTLSNALPVGHNAVATLPDRPYLHWEYAYESGRQVERYNSEDFLEASKQLHHFYGEFVKDNPMNGDISQASVWESIEGTIRAILETEADLNGRIEAWKKAIFSKILFPPTAEDQSIDYTEKDAKGWGTVAILDRCAKKIPLSDCDAYNYLKAARQYKSFVLDDLLPSCGLTA